MAIPGTARLRTRASGCTWTGSTAGWYIFGSDMNSKRAEPNNFVAAGDFAPFLVACNGQSMGHGWASNVFGQGWS